MLTKVYKYGLLPPTTGAEVVNDQLWKAHRYKNKLIEIERERRESVVQDAPKDVKDVAKDLAKLKSVAARAECDVYWGTYLQIEDAVSRAIRTTKGGPPRFQSWTGEGLLAVQIQKGVQKTDTLYRIEDAPDPRTGRRAGQRKVLWLRVSSDDGKPVWATFPLTLHRPLPARPVWVKVTRRRVANRYVYEAHFTVVISDPEREETDRGVVAIDIGWRKMPDGMRVATWRGSDGEIGELELPTSIGERLGKADHIRSVRDTLKNEVQTKLVAMLPAIQDVAVGASWSERQRKSIDKLASWKRQELFVRLFYAWKKVSEPPEFFADWVKRDRHLWQYETGCRLGGLRHRDDIYRNFACRLASRYTDVVLEDIDLREIAEYDEGETEWDKAAPSQRFIAGHSIFRTALRNAFASRGGVTIEVPSADTTRVCGFCGYLNESQRSLMITCTGCGAQYDQDHNATKNILASGLLVRDEQLTLAQEKVKTSEEKKQARLLQMSKARKEKRDRSQAALQVTEMVGA